MTTKAQADFITEIAEAARIANGESGIPASITIAQAILESGWGKTRLAAEYMNFFGIKHAHADGHNYIEFQTAEYINGKKEMVPAEFCWYKSPLDCFRAHAWLISHSGRYAPAMQLTHSAPAFALALQDCGYSTNRPPLAKKPPFYADVLMELVDEFRLRDYDVPPTPIDPAKAA